MTPAERTRFLAHIAACPNCAAYLRQIRMTVELAGQISADSAADVLGPTAMSELLGAFRAWRAAD